MLHLPAIEPHQQWLQIGQLPLSAMPSVLLQLAKQQPQPVVVLCSKAEQMDFLTENINQQSKGKVLQLPDYETLAYDHFSASEDIISERLATLSQLAHLDKGDIMLVSSTAAMQWFCPREHLLHNSLELRLGQRLNLESFAEHLIQTGYLRCQQVLHHGEFCIRGSLMDLFPMGLGQPIRLELLDDEIESLRYFEVDSQKSVGQFKELSLLPGHEIPRTQDSIDLFRRQFRETFDLAANKCSLYREVSEGIFPAGIEYWLPLFFAEQSLSSLYDYLPANCLMVHDSEFLAQLEQHWQDIEQRHENLRHDVQRPILKASALYLPPERVMQELKGFKRYLFSSSKLTEKSGQINLPISAAPDCLIDSKSDQPLAALQQVLAQYPYCLLVAESPGRRELIQDWLRSIGQQAQIMESLADFLLKPCALALTVAPLESGFVVQNEVLILGEAQLFGSLQVNQKQRRARKQADNFLRSLSELQEGDLVVHLDHGIGRYLGLCQLDTSEGAQEFVLLQYANEAKLYIPVDALELISRYSGGDPEQVSLSKLGNDRWSVQKQKAAEKIRDTAAELLEIYAKRSSMQGKAIEIGGDDYRRFCAGFPFEETEDQKRAINAVLQDLAQSKPMDRLICGDVGFGKTEVAMRAAFAVTHASRQVAILVPTTLLAQQHYDNFCDRFADWPVRVELLSRSKGAKESQKILQDLADGKIDILVGTHKILNSEIHYRDLGLLIIDEEHRFGVEQKEQIKKFRSQVDILTMTATPIPRTLSMAMNQIRDLSLIATPPAKRLAVKTFVRSFDKSLIREAILREILRGGQVYFLHNEVKQIERMAEQLQDWIPEARIGIGHGQMSERQLERVMSNFHHKRFNVLLCSTIVETGIDIPNANTIIINRADKFGLAQLHQLRGRVGRSHHQAYAWLLTPEEGKITKDAEKRLTAIAATQDLGAGFVLASHDLEIRGAGELLGAEQSGSMHNIGFGLYMELLESTVKALQQGKQLPQLNDLRQQVEVNLGWPARLPEDYMPDVAQRLDFYQRLGKCSSTDDLKEVQIELIDRFGLLPEAAKNLMAQTALQLRCKRMGIKKIQYGAQSGSIEFASNTNVDPSRLVGLVQKHPQQLRLQANILKIALAKEKPSDRLKLIEQLLDQLHTA